MNQTLELTTPWRARLAARLEHPRFQYTITALILINAVILGLETAPSIMQRWGSILRVLDQLILTCFVVEIALRFVAHGWRLLRDPWGVFDTLVVAIALVPASGPLAVLRALRVLRVLRLVSIVPSMRVVVQSLLASLPGMGSIVALLGLIFYVAAVIATQLFGEQFPEWFGTLGASLYTLFQVMTLESWSMGIVRPVMETYPYAWLYFVPFILIATFMMLNLFIAVIVDAIQHQRDALEPVQETVEDPQQLLLAEVKALRSELAELRQRLPDQDSGPDQTACISSSREQ